MLRRLFFLLATIATAALGYIAWTRREELQRAAERAQGEWRGGARGASGTAATSGRSRPRVNGPDPGEPEARVAPQPAPRPRCAATTRSGKRCTRVSEPGSEFCWQHAESS